ncbi:MAG: TetR/AcrR family transcriptional regulator [Acidobacteriaceae bacterium]|nr:TetR/AcrR family transcriptional regulator [Acidobacteriaceae bacterium]
MRLIEAAERLFIRKGFDGASVEQISEAAGYSRGAFYSNFDGKDEVFLAVIDRRRPKVTDVAFEQSFAPAERRAAVRQWFSNQWRLKDFIALRMEFSRRARRDRTVRTHLAELRRRELETYIGLMDDAGDQAPIVALVLLAAAHGLGSLAIETEPEWQDMCAQAATLVFDRLAALKSLTEEREIS